MLSAEFLFPIHTEIEDLALFNCGGRVLQFSVEMLVVRVCITLQ